MLAYDGDTLRVFITEDTASNECGMKSGKAVIWRVPIGRTCLATEKYVSRVAHLPVYDRAIVGVMRTAIFSSLLTEFLVYFLFEAVSTLFSYSKYVLLLVCPL